jgi:transcriptional regulator with XRE-family HTH domain
MATGSLSVTTIRFRPGMTPGDGDSASCSVPLFYFGLRWWRESEEGTFMSIMDFSVPTAGTQPTAPVGVPPAPRPLHRLAEVRRLQGVTRRTIARRLNTDITTVKQQEQESADMLLSTLYAWQQVLEVPIGELLVDTEDALSPPVAKRAQFVRLMKTATAILERSQQPSIKRMAQMLVEQLCEIMPELEGVSPWHAVGRRRTQDELGQAAFRRLSADVFQDLVD